MKSRCSSLNSSQALLLAPDASMRNLSCSDRRHLTFRRNTSAECLKAAQADVVHEVFRKDASTRIPSAEEQDLKLMRRSLHRKQTKSLSSVAKRYRPVATILATASARSSIALSGLSYLFAPAQSWG